MTPLDDQIAKYEGWIAEIESRRSALGESRRIYFRVFAASIVLAIPCFFWNAWFGVAALFTGIMFVVTGAYLVVVRGDEYARELKRNRRELAALREQRAATAS